MPVYALDGIVPALPPQGRYFVAPGARVIGNVTLHDEASVWFGAVLRGDNDKITVGARSNIQDNAMVHVDPGFPVSIGEGCTIGHHAILHGCNIGDRSFISARNAGAFIRKTRKDVQGPAFKQNLTHGIVI